MQTNPLPISYIRIKWATRNIRKGKALGVPSSKAHAPEPVKRHAHYNALLREKQWPKSPFRTRSKEEPKCPLCGMRMKYRDSLKRNEKKAGGEIQPYLISRYHCEPCNHTLRVLPDFLAPFKHYNVGIIMDVIDEKITSDDLEYENYPCERTMWRWKEWFKQNEIFIGEYLLICEARLIAYGLTLLYALVASLGDIRAHNEHWLTTVIQIVYNTGAVLDPFREDSS